MNKEAKRALTLVAGTMLATTLACQTSIGSQVEATPTPITPTTKPDLDNPELGLSATSVQATKSANESTGTAIVATQTKVAQDIIELKTPIGRITLTAPVKPTETSTQVSTTSAEEGLITSYLFPPDLLISANSEGRARIDMNKLRNNLKTNIPTQGNLQNGDVDFISQMLGTKFGKNGVPKSHKLNFWMDQEVGGLGWKESDVDHIYDDLNKLRQQPRDQVFSDQLDGTFRFAVRVTNAKDFENAVAYAVIFRYLHGAGKLTDSDADIQTYLSDPNVDIEIKATTEALIGSTGYKPLSTKSTTPVVAWPGAASLFKSNSNFKPDNWTQCVTSMDKANTRASQKEKSNKVTYTEDLEKTSPKNDETISASDSNGESVLFFLYDSNADAMTNGAYSPNDKGYLRLDEVRVTNYQDSLNKNISNPNDNIEGEVAVDLGRVIPCGEEVIIAKPQPVKPAAPSQPKQPEQPTTPPQRPTNPPLPSPMPTNKDTFPVNTSQPAPTADVKPTRAG